MDEQTAEQLKLYDFIQEHLKIRFEEGSGRDYLRAGEGLAEYKTVTVNLVLIHPLTGDETPISSDTFTLG